MTARWFWSAICGLLKRHFCNFEIFQSLAIQVPPPLPLSLPPGYCLHGPAVRKWFSMGEWRVGGGGGRRHWWWYWVNEAHRPHYVTDTSTVNSSLSRTVNTSPLLHSANLCCVCRTLLLIAILCCPLPSVILCWPLLPLLYFAAANCYPLLPSAISPASLCYPLLTSAANWFALLLTAISSAALCYPLLTSAGVHFAANCYILCWHLLYFTAL